jgi:hypothetical protein
LSQATVVGLAQDHLPAVLVAQQADARVVEAADFQHGHERLPVAQALAGELLQEGGTFSGCVETCRAFRTSPSSSRNEIVICCFCRIGLRTVSHWSFTFNW